MPTKVIPIVTAWSYSRLNTYRKCPFLFRLTVLEKKKEPESVYLIRGQAVHKECEDFVKKPKGPITDSMKPFTKEFKALKKLDVDAETQWAFTKDWTPTEWFASNTWNRMVIDAATPVVVKHGKAKVQTLRVIDYKTGKIYEENKEQLGLYALGGFSRYPEVELVTTELWYLDQGEERKLDFHRDEVPGLKTYWAKETKAMFNDHTYAPRAGDYCRYCHFRKSNGGPCKY